MKKIFLMIPVVLFPLSASPQIKEGSTELSPFVGYNQFDKRQNLKDGHVFGGRLGYNFTKHFAIEGTVQFVDTHVDNKSIFGAKEGQFRSPMDKIDLTFYHVDAVFNFMPDSSFTPFIMVGTGGARYSPKISDKDMSTFNIGVGAKFWMAEHFALRLDISDNLVTEVSPFQFSYRNLTATVGVVFAFGGAPKYVPTAVVIPEPKPVEPVGKVEKVVIVMAEEPAPKIEEKVKVVTPEPKVFILAFEDVHFDFDKSTLTPEAKSILRRSVQTLKDNPNAKIRIAGYTSAAGTDAYNQKLSERRAKAVQAFLLTEGIITQDRLSTIGYGETRPAEYEAAPMDLYSKAAKANMRVLFEVVVK